ncbi:unnamed protein product, partial [Rotaria sp. Silwood2]
YKQTAINQKEYYENQYKIQKQKIFQEQDLLPINERLTTRMLELVQQRDHIIEERQKYIYDYKNETLSNEN